MRTPHIHRALLACLLLAYLAVSLPHLDTVPRVYPDEPWQASTGWKLAEEGVFGSDLFAGWHGMERRYYGFMPLHPLLLAASFKIGGLGLFQARFETVLLGLAVLLLTYSLGRRLLDASTAIVAVSLLLTLRLTLTTPYLLSGIPLIDLARIARYDMLVPVLGLLALLAYLRADDSGHSWLFTLAGLLAGLATLGHVYGAFWLLGLGWVALVERRGWRVLAALAVGFALPCLGYLGYVFGGVQEWSGQVRDYGPRFQLFDPRWYLDNLLRERHRYGQGLGAAGWGWVLRPGFWLALVAIPASLLAFGRRAWRGSLPASSESHRAALLLLLPTLVFVTLYALLIWLKLINYIIAFLPLVALMVASLVMHLWRNGQRGRRLFLIAAALAVVLEGGSQVAGLHRAAANTTPWPQLAAELRRQLPADSGPVLLLHDYWLGLQEFNVRSWVVPVVKSHPRYYQPPLNFAAAVDEVAPTTLVIDRQIRRMLAHDQVRREHLAVWLQRHDFRLIAEIDDSTYGHFEICSSTSPVAAAQPETPCPLPGEMANGYPAGLARPVNSLSFPE